MIINTNLSSLFTNRTFHPLLQKGMDVFTADILHSFETEKIKNLKKEDDKYSTLFSMDVKFNESWKTSKISVTFEKSNTFVFTFFDELSQCIAEKLASYLQHHPSFRIKFLLKEYKINIKKDPISEMTDAMERLSSGKRINDAADEAAGISVEARLTCQIKKQKEK